MHNEAETRVRAHGTLSTPDYHGERHRLSISNLVTQVQHERQPRTAASRPSVVRSQQKIVSSYDGRPHKDVKSLSGARPVHAEG